MRLLLACPKFVLTATAAEANSMNRWLLSLACLSVLLPSPLQANDQPMPTEDASRSVLPFRLSSGYLIQVEGRIGSQTHLKFLLDTGASISIVGQKFAQKLKLPLRPAQSFNFDRNLRWETTTIPDVQFGPVRAANVAVLVGDLTRYSEFAGKADAIIGMDLLRLSDFTVEYGSSRLIFDPGPPRTYLPGGDPMDKCLIVELQVQGRRVRLIVDTGMQGILLYEERLRRNVPELRTVGTIKNASLGGRLSVKQATLPDVLLGNRNRNLPVVLVSAPAGDILPGIDGVVGITALQARRIHFDFAGKTVSWE
ncbi:MAG TPA: aspartyl protease family protein [Acidobacteriaceae bacterium]|nr:aspartyl protease family protein [Acidobacteriaceae bacterium]